jgi:ABC-type Mn2+/Zn2+ transport system ATPase subunit
MKQTSSDLRNQRFEPIAGEAQRTWELLRQHSNVELARPELEGTGTRRRVKLDVTVDGLGGAALRVMSQGELHALALSLFLPRAMLPESPFRFIVMDDPVQSMDPARVDGLARVLEEVGRKRQLVVFTHDATCLRRSGA